MRQPKNFLFFLLIGLFFLIAFDLSLFSSFQKPSNAKVLCQDCNVVWVSFTDLRTSNVHSYGYTRSTTPNIDSFTQTGFKFINEVSVAPWTLPSAMSWFTGVYPSKHKILNSITVESSGTEVVSSPEIIDNVLLTLPQVFKQNNYSTGGFTGGAALDRKFGFAKGFDTYNDSGNFLGFDTTIPEALNWISTNKDKKLFVFLETYDLHGQHVPQGGYDKRFVDFNYQGTLTGSAEEQKTMRENALTSGQVLLSSDDVRFLKDLYDEKLQRADEAFGKFVDEYKKLGLMDKTIFIITADHGDEYYEHGRIDHGHSLYDELIHVPLIIWLPGNSKPTIINKQTRSIDIMPTLLKIAGIPLSQTLKSQVEGTSLIPLMQGKNLNLDVYPETDYRYAVFLRAIRTSDNFKYILNIENGEEELYNLTADPNEQHNIIYENPKKAKLLKQLLLKHIQEMKS